MEALDSFSSYMSLPCGALVPGSILLSMRTELDVSFALREQGTCGHSLVGGSLGEQLNATVPISGGNVSACYAKDQRETSRQ
jgi:hypothetical protein